MSFVVVGCCLFPTLGCFTMCHPVFIVFPAQIPPVALDKNCSTGEFSCLSPENSSLRRIKGSLPHGEYGAGDVSPGHQAIEHRLG